MIHRTEWSSSKLFIALVAVNMLIVFSINHLFFNDNLYYFSLAEQMTTYRIDKIIELSKKWQWMQYTFLILILLFSFSKKTHNLL